MVDDTNTPTPLLTLPSEPRRARARTTPLRILLATIQRVTGIEAAPQQVLEVLAEEVARLGAHDGDPGVEVSFRRTEMLALLEAYRHQALIDRVAAWGGRTFGKDSTYADSYPAYVREARAQGWVPFSLKSFKNRAFKDPLQLKAEALEAAARYRRKHAA